MKPSTIGRNTGAEKGDLSNHETHPSQFAREIFLLVQTDENRSLPSMEKKAEPSGARLTTNDIITVHKKLIKLLQISHFPEETRIAK